MTFGERLDLCLQQNEITAAELGRRIHVSQAAINGWRKRGLFPRADIACDVAKSLTTTVEYLITGEISSQEQTLPADLLKFKDLNKSNQNAVLTLVNALYKQEELDFMKKNENS